MRRGRLVAVGERLRLSRLPRHLLGDLRSLRRSLRRGDGRGFGSLRSLELGVRGGHDFIAPAALLLLGAMLRVGRGGFSLLSLAHDALNLFSLRSLRFARVALGGDQGGSLRRLQVLHLADHSLVLGSLLGLEDAAALLKLALLRGVRLSLGRGSGLGGSFELSLGRGVGGVTLRSKLRVSFCSLGGFLLAAQALLLLVASLLSLGLFLLAFLILLSLGLVRQQQLLLNLLLRGVGSLRPALQHHAEARDDHRVEPPVVIPLGQRLDVGDDITALVQDGLHLQVKHLHPLLPGYQRRGHPLGEVLKLPAYLHGLRRDVTARILPRGDRGVDLVDGFPFEGDPVPAIFGG